MRIVYYVVLAFATILCSTQSSLAITPVNYSARTIGISGQANAINNSGQIVGTMYDASGGAYAFFWSQSTGVIKLGPGSATDINSEGRVVGGAYIDGGYKAFSWKLGEWPRYLGDGEAHAINDSGMIVGTVFLDANTPVVWKPSGEQVIVETVSVGDNLDINNNGVVTGYTPYPGYHSFTWTEATGVNLLPTSPQGEYHLAHCINDNGQIAGHKTGGPTWACAWQSDKSSMYYLPSIGVNSVAEGINNKGQIVGYYGSGYNACLWETDGTVIDLASLISAPWSKALDINDSGVVVGYQNDNGNMQVVIWEPVPEPSSICGLATGLLGFIGVVRLRRRS